MQNFNFTIAIYIFDSLFRQFAHSLFRPLVKMFAKNIHQSEIRDLR